MRLRERRKSARLRLRLRFFLSLSLSLSLLFTSCNREAAEQKGKDKISETRDDMVQVDAGEFMMGSNKVEIKEEALKPLEPLFKAEAPRHKVFLKAFYIDKFEVTNLKYKKFVDAAQKKPPANWDDGRYPDGRDNHPVALVSWYDADDYCRWAGKRLPTEAEWEKAARGTDGREFPWGSGFDGSKANTEESKIDDTIPVGSFESGKSPYGIYDMVGNVWEWTADWYQPYPGNQEKNDFYGDGFRVARGGAHGTSGGHYIIQQLYRTSFRFFFAPDRVYTDVGFRCVKDER